MSLVLVLAAVVSAGVVVGVVAGVVGGGLAPAARERPRAVLHAPLGHLHEHDVAGLRLSTSVRGYRMDEVDAVLDRLRAELAARDAGATLQLDPPAARAADRPDDRPERG